MNDLINNLQFFSTVTVMNVHVYKLKEGRAYNTNIDENDFEYTGLCLDTLKVSNIKNSKIQKSFSLGLYNIPLIQNGRDVNLEITDSLGRFRTLQYFYNFKHVVNEWDEEFLYLDNTFAAPLMLKGVTPIININGDKKYIQITFPCFIPSGDFNLALQNSGDATTFNLNGTLYPISRITSNSNITAYYFIEPYNSDHIIETQPHTTSNLETLLDIFGMVTVMDIHIYEYNKLIGKEPINISQLTDTGICLQTLKISDIKSSSAKKQFHVGNHNIPIARCGRTVNINIQDALGNIDVLQYFCNIQVQNSQLIYIPKTTSKPLCLVGHTWIIKPDGTKEKLNITLPLFIPSNILNIQMSAEGDAAVFDLNGSLYPVSLSHVAADAYMMIHTVPVTYEDQWYYKLLSDGTYSVRIRNNTLTNYSVPTTYLNTPVTQLTHNNYNGNTTAKTFTTSIAPQSSQVLNNFTALETLILGANITNIPSISGVYNLNTVYCNSSVLKALDQCINLKHIYLLDEEIDFNNLQVLLPILYNKKFYIHISNSAYQLNNWEILRQFSNIIVTIDTDNPYFYSDNAGCIFNKDRTILQFCYKNKFSTLDLTGVQTIHMNACTNVQITYHLICTSDVLQQLLLQKTNIHYISLLTLTDGGQGAVCDYSFNNLHTIYLQEHVTKLDYYINTPNLYNIVVAEENEYLEAQPFYNDVQQIGTILYNIEGNTRNIIKGAGTFIIEQLPQEYVGYIDKYAFYGATITGDGDFNINTSTIYSYAFANMNVDTMDINLTGSNIKIHNNAFSNLGIINSINLSNVVALQLQVFDNTQFNTCFIKDLYQWCMIQNIELNNPLISNHNCKLYIQDGSALPVEYSKDNTINNKYAEITFIPSYTFRNAYNDPTAPLLDLSALSNNDLTYGLCILPDTAIANIIIPRLPKQKIIVNNKAQTIQYFELLWYYYEDAQQHTNANINTHVPDSYLNDAALDGGCLSLNITLTESDINVWGSASFRNCKFLKSCQVNNNMTQIPTGVFRNCPNLTDFTLPTNLDFLGINCFYGCNKIVLHIKDPNRGIDTTTMDIWNASFIDNEEYTDNCIYIDLNDNYTIWGGHYITDRLITTTNDRGDEIPVNTPVIHQAVGLNVGNQYTYTIPYYAMDGSPVIFNIAEFAFSSSNIRYLRIPNYVNNIGNILENYSTRGIIEYSSICTLYLGSAAHPMNAYNIMHSTALTYANNLKNIIIYNSGMDTSQAPWSAAQATITEYTI